LLHIINIDIYWHDGRYASQRVLQLNKAKYVTIQMSTTTAASYSRVPTSDNNNNNNNNSNDTTTPSAARHKRSISSRSLSDRITDKIWASAWVFLAIVVAYWTDFFSVLLLHQHPNTTTTAVANRGLLQLVAVCFGINTVLFLYLSLYLPLAHALPDSTAWEAYCPRVIPVCTATSALAALLLIRATWPVWGFLAPVILGLQAMGALFGLHFVPWPC
jgi:hypothetical protein